MDVLFYEGQHSVIIGDKHSWADWHMIPTTKPMVPPPEVQTKYIDIPGKNGKLDATDVLTGGPLYGQRKIEMTFLYDPTYLPYEEMFPKVANYVHGQRRRLILTDDPEYFYEGRFSISKAECGPESYGFSITGDLDPYKLSLSIVPGCENVSVAGTKTVTVSIGTSPLNQIPYISSSAAMNVTLQRSDESTVRQANIISGRYRYPAIALGPGRNVLTFTGTGTVTIEARKGGF